MPIKLRPGEIAFYPQPFVESEPNLTVITNQRVIHFGEEGHQEVPAKEVSHLGRVSQRPMLVLGIVLALVGVPLFGTGAYLFFSVKGPLTLASLTAGAPDAGPAAAPAPNAAGIGDDPSAVPLEEGAELPPPDEPSSSMSPGLKRIIGLVLAALGLLLLGGGVLALRVEEHFVMVRGGIQVLKISATDKIQQNQILMTVQAAQQGAKSGGGAPAAAPAKPKVEVDDKGDPVKALQELAAARQAGKIKDDEFQAKREVLLERLKGRG